MMMMTVIIIMPLASLFLNRKSRMSVFSVLVKWQPVFFLPRGKWWKVYPVLGGFAWSDMVHGCMVYTELAPRWLQFHVAPAMPALKYTTLVEIQKNAL